MKKAHRFSNVAAIFLALTALFFRPCAAPAQTLSMDRQRVEEMLDTVVQDIQKNFYDAGLKGVDWKPLVKHARERIENANSRSDMFMAIFALVNKLDDSHTVFLPPSRVTKVKFGMEAMAFGDEIRIFKLKKDGAAEKAGLKVGDRITAINGFKVDRKSYDLVQLIFRMLRPSETMDVMFTRGAEPLQTIHVEGDVKKGEQVLDLTDIDAWYQLIREMENEEKDEEKVHGENYENGTGYLKLPDFEYDEAIVDHQLRKVKDSRALIIDLRRNGGGAEELLKRFSGYFETEPVVMATVQTRKKTEEIKIKPHGSALGMPLFVLVDARTASAGEMFARHFQMTGRAKVIGDGTAKKVNAARIFTHDSGTDVVISYAVQIAVGRVVLPGGEELERRGVTPDKLCIPTAEDQVAGRDPCLDLAKTMAAATLQVPAAPAAPAAAATPAAAPAAKP